MTVQKGADLFKKVPVDDLGVANAPSQEKETHEVLERRGIDAGRDLFTDKKGDE